MSEVVDVVVELDALVAGRAGPLLVAAPVDDELDELSPGARAYAHSARAAATWRAYGVAWRAWAAYAAGASLVPLPARAVDVAGYLAARAAAGARWSTLAHAIAVLSLAHRLIGVEPPGRSPIVRAVLAGIRREHGTAATHAAPLRLADLRAVLDELDRGSVTGACQAEATVTPGASRVAAEARARDARAIDVRDRAILLVAWCGAMRRSELVGLDRRDLVRHGDAGIAVTIRGSKTDVAGAGETIGIPLGRRPVLCAVRALDAWIALLDAAGLDGPLFRSIDRWGAIGDRLGDRAVALIVERRARAAGYPAGAFSGHSFRSGFASELAAAGVPEREIARQTRHKSMAILRRYIHAGGLFVDPPVSRVL